MHKETENIEADITEKLLNYYEYAEVRIATLLMKEEGNNKSSNNLIFATINLLPTGFETSHTSSLTSEDSKLGTIYFRKVVMSAEDALSWYRVENSQQVITPKPLNTDEKSIDIQEANFTDDTVWGDFGIPLNEKSIFDNSGGNPAPFLGYSGDRNSNRIHRRFGNQDALTPLIEDTKAIKFLEQCLHINFQDYSEYLGSMVLILPNPIIESIENRLLPNDECEQRLLKITPHPSQKLEDLKIVTLEVHLGLLKNVKTENIPNDGIMTFEHNNQFQEDNFFIMHNELGCINFKPPTSYLRQMNFGIGIHSKTRDVHSKVSNRKKAHDYNYEASVVSRVSESVIGEVTQDKIYTQVTNAKRKRQEGKLKKDTGQRWFGKGERKEALDEIGRLIGNAKSRIVIFDPYFGIEQITQFTLRAETAQIPIEIVTSKSVFEVEEKVTKIKNFNNQLIELNNHEDINIECLVVIDEKSMHDRFLVIDADIWFIGHSLNEVGNSNSFMVKVPVPKDIWSNLDEIKEKASSFEDFYNEEIS